MNLKSIAIVYRKELTDTVRDRRFLVSSILVPILLFPVMTIGLGGLIFAMAQRTAQKDQAVMVFGAAHAPTLASRLEKTIRLQGGLGELAVNLDIVPAGKDYAQQINDKKLQAAVDFPEGLEEKLRSHPDQQQTIKIYYYQNDVRSSAARRAIRRVINEYAEELKGARLAARNLSLELLTPFLFERSNVASAEKVSGAILGFILPYMIILLSLTGAMYPAMDLTAGEKERGTLETILASPAGRMDIVGGKFLLVLTVSLVTTLTSIGSMVGTALMGAQFLARINPNLVFQISVKSIATVFFIMLPLAIFFAAALLAISIFARSYKEAQSYIGPLMFLVILPAMGSFLPGVELNAKMALIPILNVSLLAKEVFSGQYPLDMIALIFGSTTVYAAIALFFAFRQFQKEEVLFRA